MYSVLAERDDFGHARFPDIEAGEDQSAAFDIAIPSRQN
jgi:hypothetical protein